MAAASNYQAQIQRILANPQSSGFRMSGLTNEDGAPIEFAPFSRTGSYFYDGYAFTPNGDGTYLAYRPKAPGAASDLNGTMADVVDGQGNVIGQQQLKGIGTTAGDNLLGGIMTLMMGGAMGATMAGVGAAAGAAGGAAGGGAGAAPGALDLGGGISMGADGAIGGATPFATSGMSNAAILDSVGAGGLDGVAGTSGLAGAGSGVFNPAADSQLASSQLGLTAGDTASGAIPSVTVNGAPLTSQSLQSALASSGLTPSQVASNPSLLQQVAQTLGVSPSTLTSLIGPAVSAIGGALGANAASSAAKDAATAQLQAAQSGIDEWRRQFDTVRGLLGPFAQAGTQAVGAQSDLAGLNGPDKQQAAITQLQTMPAYTSQLKLGENRILQNASATGGLRGGNTEGALGYFAPQLLAQTINDQYARLGGLTSIGQNAAAGVGNAGMGVTQGITGLMQQGGAAQAGSDIASGVATQKLYGGLSTALGQIFGYGGGMPGSNTTAGTTTPVPDAVTPPNPFI